MNGNGIILNKTVTMDMWKVLGVILIMIVLVWFVTKYSECVYNPNMVHDLVFHYRFNSAWLKETIVKVHKIISPIAEDLKKVLPVTNRISHWMLCMELANGVLVMCSSAPFGWIELYRVTRKGDILLNKDRPTWKAFIKASFSNITKYTLGEFIDIYTAFYKSFDKYSFFDNNCQKMTSHALENIFHVNSPETVREKYDMGIVSEYFRNMIPRRTYSVR